MATYTVQLRTICDIYGREEVENWFKNYKLSDYLMPTQIEQLEKFSVWNKNKLASKIVDHFYMREIGYETPELFKHFAKVKMQEIMEKYLLLIYSKFLEFDPLSNVDYTETYTRKIQGTAENEGSSNSQSNSNSSGLNVHNDTSQGQIDKNEVLSGKYATTVDANESEASVNDKTQTSNNSSSQTLETYEHSMKGDNGVIVTNQYLVREFRELAVSFDTEIIKEVNSLFMAIY